MGLFNFFKKSNTPYKDDQTDLIYELLFCDDVELYKANTKESAAYPWSVIFSSSPEKAELDRLIGNPDVESRIKILAFNKLKSIGIPSETKELLGVIVEVALNGGLDTLAAFSDGTTRYINHTGSILVGETGDEKSAHLTDQLFLESRKVIEQIGPWDKPRRKCPEKGNVRITFLLSDELYFGEGPINVLFTDPLARASLSAATALMKYLMEKTTYK